MSEKAWRKPATVEAVRMTALLISTLLLLIAGSCSASIGPERSANEAAARDADTIYVVIFIILFFLAMRHVNDFYTGETITLVEEGATSGRFHHKVETRMLTSIERDFNNMYEQLKDKEDMRIKAEQAIKEDQMDSHTTV
ncbi:unnamed protein product [Cylicocyclus nassatus]|uniref:HAMP domain-containing protein n=1 Tax=Cylicocyclus nassatus TaxID=53992 RepID=A0AA36MGI2_CYLNA|nr:unnamed protein product [Cylicocyclus nassatus]